MARKSTYAPLRSDPSPLFRAAENCLRLGNAYRARLAQTTFPPGALHSLRSLFLDAYTSGDGTVCLMVFPAETQIPPLRHRPLGTVRYGDIDGKVHGYRAGFPSGEGSDRPGVELPGEGRFVFEITVCYSADRYPATETTEDFTRYKVTYPDVEPEKGKARIEAFRQLAKKAATILRLSGNGTAFDNLELLWLFTLHKLVPGRTHDAYLASIEVLSLLESGERYDQVAPAAGDGQKRPLGDVAPEVIAPPPSTPPTDGVDQGNGRKGKVGRPSKWEKLLTMAAEMPEADDQKVVAAYNQRFGNRGKHPVATVQNLRNARHHASSKHVDQNGNGER